MNRQASKNRPRKIPTSCSRCLRHITRQTNTTEVSRPGLQSRCARTDSVVNTLLIQWSATRTSVRFSSNSNTLGIATQLRHGSSNAARLFVPTPGNLPAPDTAVLFRYLLGRDRVPKPETLTTYSQATHAEKYCIDISAMPNSELVCRFSIALQT